MANVVVTGGAGFIGSHIVDLLKSEGHRIAVIDDLSSGSRENLPSGVDLHVLDIRSKEARSLLQNIRPDLVVHTAAQISVRRSMEDPMFDTEVNVAGMVNLLQAFMGGKGSFSPRWIFLSTGGAIYGDQEVYPASEDHPVRPTSVYGHAKRVGETYLEFWAREFGLEFTALRLANVYGPRQNPHGEAGVVAIFLKKLLAGEVPVVNGSGEQTRDFVYVGDVARAVDAAFKKRASGIYNIGTGVESSVNLVLSIILKSLNKNLEAPHAPAKLGEQLRSSISAAKALRELGWKPERALEEGLRLTSEWFKSVARK